MNKEEYQKALENSKWKRKRNYIKKRDGYKCTKCGEKESLHVHHTYYLVGKMPWEVPNDCLITLCSGCHEKEHEGRDISSFVRTEPPNKKKSVKKKKKGSKNSRLLFDSNMRMNKDDKELQKKYDELKQKGKLPESTYKQLENPSRKKKRKKK